MNKFALNKTRNDVVRLTDMAGVAGQRLRLSNYGYLTGRKIKGIRHTTEYFLSPWNIMGGQVLFTNVTSLLGITLVGMDGKTLFENIPLCSITPALSDTNRNVFSPIEGVFDFDKCYLTKYADVAFSALIGVVLEFSFD